MRIYVDVERDGGTFVPDGAQLTRSASIAGSRRYILSCRINETASTGSNTDEQKGDRELQQKSV